MSVDAALESISFRYRYGCRLPCPKLLHSWDHDGNATLEDVVSDVVGLARVLA